jgi:hypothetical protein
MQFAAAQVDNDECSAAITIPSVPFAFFQNTRLASENDSDPRLFCQDSLKNGKTVWFKYTPDTSRFIVFSTIGSQPVEDYDIVLALFSGTCGALTLEECNDDTMDVRQAVVGAFLQAGKTYFLMVGEWGGGGPNGGIPTGGDLHLSVSVQTMAPLVRGPRTGRLNGGVMTTTDNFHSVSEMPSPGPKLKKPEVNKQIPKLPPPASMKTPTGLYGSNYYEDRSPDERSTMANTVVSRPVALQSFEGVPQTTFIPPDPILAVGPNHVMAAVNSTFRIFDKNGTVLKTIDADLWYGQVLQGASTFDPILMYDHFDSRWIMVMLHVDDAKRTAAVFLSVSDDSDPLGTWYNWALPAHMLGDSVVSNWSDYARVGFDKDAIYITSNQFGFTYSFSYCKLRIIPKAQLYANTGRSVTWTDFWDFRDPDNLSTVVQGIRPSIIFGEPKRQFLLNDSPYFLGTFFTLWTLDSSITAPVLNATNVPVVQYFPSPDADQKEGSSIPIETFGADIRNEPVYRDSALWAVHAVASGPQKEYASVRYLKVDPFLKKTQEDVVFGLDGYWHSYPALMVNTDGDVIITYSRSGLDEYIGAFMTGRKKSDPPGLAPSVTIRDGRGNYVVSFGAVRNRWGDYSGIGLDPSDGRSVWTHTEFAAARNRWGTWVTRSVLGPVPGSKLTANRSFINFGSKLIGTSSDTVTIMLTNDGTEELTISALSTSTSSFVIVQPTTFPLVIPSMGSYPLKVCFIPKVSGIVSDTIRYCPAQDCITLSTLAAVSGTGSQIVTPVPGTMYAVGGSSDGGNLYSVNTSNGAVSFLANSGLKQVASLRVHPVTKEFIGLDPTAMIDGGSIYRLSPTGSNPLWISNITIINLKGLSFQNGTFAYMADFNGRIFRVNVPNGSYTQLISTGLRISGVAEHPIDGSVWFTLRATSGMLDGIYRFDTLAGTMRMVGRTGLGIANADLVFDKNGTLFVLAGIGSTPNKLLVVDTATGQAQKILELGMSNLTSIALDPDAVASVQRSSGTVPKEFSLQQNYPNPFNPLTVIEYSLPKPAEVKLIVVDELGRIVQTLAQGWRPEGYHREYFDAAGLSSGVYYYHLSAGPFSAGKRMLLVK